MWWMLISLIGSATLDHLAELQANAMVHGPWRGASHAGDGQA
jgi:hypothetical protein